MATVAWLGVVAATAVAFLILGRKLGAPPPPPALPVEAALPAPAESDSSFAGETARRAAGFSARDLNLEERALTLDERERSLHERAAALDEREARVSRTEEEREQERRAVEAKRIEREKEIEALRAARKRHEDALAEAARMTADEAKRELLHGLRENLDAETASEVAAAHRAALARADEDARRVVAVALGRLAADAVRESSAEELFLPHESLKGKIIGKDGANIRAFEDMTGVNLIVDDAPRLVLLSSFDAERRDTAKRVLMKMVETGKFHPAAVEEILRAMNPEEDALLAGRAALREAVLDERADARPEILRLMGRLRFQSAYGQNVLRHSVEVAHLAGIMADELGLDGALARRAGFFHDVGKSVAGVAGAHSEAGAREAERFGEPPPVVNAVAAHHDDVKPASLEAALVAAANAVSESRPGARHRAAGDPIRRMIEAEQIAREFPGVAAAYAVHAEHEVRVIVSERDADDRKTEELAAAIARRLRSEVEYSGKINVTVVRETRAEAVAS